MARPRAIVVGIGGLELSAEEEHLLVDLNPLGIILFSRNVCDAAQLRRLTSSVRDCLGREDAPILIDQEGGRVARLRPPLWRRYPAQRRIGELAERDPEAGEWLAHAVAVRIALDVQAIGIDWVCAPVLDLLWPETHTAIGDRAYAGDPELVARLGRAAVAGFLEGGVVPIVKHLPGHGRATVDSHHALPRVEASRADLMRTDFVPFRRLADAPAAMTAHICYTALDAHHPFTTSPLAVEAVAREGIGMRGLLFTDDIDMRALGGSVADRVGAVMDAGHDVALQCNGKLVDLRAALEAATEMSAAAWMRYTGARERLARSRSDDVDVSALDAELSAAGV